jgi:DNA-directed RNA polymerase subunit RPC12/RpoP
MPEGYSPLEGGGQQRTEMHCHACNKNFIAELDFDINGDHVVECAHCGHEHCRTIKDGKITEARWDGRNNANAIRVSKNSVWKSNVIAAQTSTVASFIRERWLNRSDFNGH